MYKQAFTLIETIVVITIILLFTGLGVASYNSFNDAKKLESATDQLTDIIELARTKTMSRDIPLSSDVIRELCATFYGYQVELNASNSQYFLKLQCQKDDGTTFLSTISTYKYPPEIQVTSPVTIFSFAYPNGNASVLENTTIRLKSSITQKCRNIIIKPVGLSEVIQNDSCQ